MVDAAELSVARPHAGGGYFKRLSRRTYQSPLSKMVGLEGKQRNAVITVKTRRNDRTKLILVVVVVVLVVDFWSDLAIKIVASQALRSRP
jgi:hypothetical protein